VERYRQVRRRNHEINRAAVEQWPPVSLISWCSRRTNADLRGFPAASKGAAGADQEGQGGQPDRAVRRRRRDGRDALLHFVHEHMEQRPRVAVLYLDPAGAQRVAPFEDRPFAENLAARRGWRE